MIRMPLATASLLAIAISLAGCGEDKKDTAPAAQAPAAAPASAPAAAKVDEAAVKAVVKNYADIAEATFGDALSTSQALQKAVDTLLAEPNEANLKAARDAWLVARKP